VSTSSCVQLGFHYYEGPVTLPLLTFLFPFALFGEFFATSITSISNCFYVNAYVYVLIVTLSEASPFVFLGRYMLLMLLRFLLHDLMLLLVEMLKHATKTYCQRGVNWELLVMARDFWQWWETSNNGETWKNKFMLINY
jgi:hypothetical protein